MKRFAGNLSALTLLLATGHGAADVIYSGPQNITIPTTYGGTYIDVENMTSSLSSFTGWDFNPFMGGLYLYNSADFQPARDGTGTLDTVLNFASGSTIDSNLNFATGSGGSLDHLGSTFTDGQEGYLGFKLNSTDYGWMRVVFTNNQTGALVKDWAYNTGGSIATGNVIQSGSTFTVDSVAGSFTLGSAINGSNSVIKTGANTVTLATANSYNGGTTINAGTLSLTNAGAAGSGGITLSGSNEAHLEIVPGITIANDIVFSNTNAGSSVKRTVAASTAYTTGTSGDLKSSFSGGTPDTTAQILASQNATSESILNMSFSASSDATNDGARRSDVFKINGTTGTDAYVIQILVDGGLASDSRIGWLDTINNTWVNVSSNLISGAYNNILTVGNYGFDPDAGGTGVGGVWAVVNYSGSFAAIPEPTTALAGLLLTAGLLRRRRRNVEC